MTSRVADEMEEQLQTVTAGDYRTRQQLQVRQATLRMISLQCYGGSWQLEPADVAHMAQLMVLINHGQLFFEDAYFEDPEQEQMHLAAMRTRCHNVMAARCQDLLQVGNERGDCFWPLWPWPDMTTTYLPAPDVHNGYPMSSCLMSYCLQAAVGSSQHVLTAAVKCILQRAPSGLSWRQLTENGLLCASFEAFDSASNHLYSINLLDGTVLLDGLPPSRLPKDITTHPLFKYVP
jgi:hypothetical protein